MRRPQATFSGAVFSALLALCAAGPATAADKLVFQFGWIPGGDRAAYYLAKSAGLFAAQGLDVELRGGKGSTDTLTKLAAGSVDMGEGGLDALFTAKIQADLPVTAVMPVYTVPPDALITTTDSGIVSLKDVAGKIVGTSPFTSSNGPWPYLLTMNGVDPDKVNLLKADAAALTPLLATGKVNAIISYVTNADASAAALKAIGKTMRVIPWKDYGLTGYSASIFASHKMLATRRGDVIKFTQALKQAEEMMRADPEKAAAAVKIEVPEIDLPLSITLAKATVPLIFSDNTQKDGLGVFSPQLVATTWDWVAKQQKTPPNPIDLSAAVDYKIAKGE